jgi:hypothetical protein
LVKLTRDGEEFLQRLSLHHLQELQTAGPKFVKVLRTLIDESSSDDDKVDVDLPDSNTTNPPRRDTNHG